MEVTDSQLLPYPEGTDPANGALDLQVLAEAIDAKLTAAFAAYRTVVNCPVFMTRLSTNQTGIASGVSTTINFDQIIYDTTGAESPSANIPIFTRTGYYRVGSYVVSNPSGGVTANSSVRTFIVCQRQLVTPLFGTAQEFFDSTTYQSSTGGEEQSAQGLLRIDSVSNPGLSFIRCDILHLNAASTVNVIAGSRMWFHWVSDLEN